MIFQILIGRVVQLVLNL